MAQSYQEKYTNTTEELTQIVKQPNTQLLATRSIAPLEKLAEKLSSTRLGRAIGEDARKFPEQQRVQVRHRIYSGAVTLLSNAFKREYNFDDKTALLDWIVITATQSEQTRKEDEKTSKKYAPGIYLPAYQAGIQHLEQLTQELPENYIPLFKRTLDATEKLAEYSGQDFRRKDIIKKGLEQISQKMQQAGMKATNQGSLTEFDKYQKLLADYVKTFPKELEQTRIMTRKQVRIKPNKTERGFDGSLIAQISTDGRNYTIAVPYEQIAKLYGLPTEPPNLSDDQIKGLIQDLEQ